MEAFLPVIYLRIQIIIVNDNIQIPVEQFLFQLNGGSLVKVEIYMGIFLPELFDKGRKDKRGEKICTAQGQLSCLQLMKIPN